MTQHAVVVPGSVPTDISGTFTVDGNKLPRSVPTDRVTATLTNPNSPQVSLPPITGIADQRRKFLETVLAWPADINSPYGWINVHVNAKNRNPSDTSPKNNGGKPWVVGWPFKTVDDVLNRISWV